MPSMSASTTAVFTSIGLEAQDIYDVMVGLIGTAVDFGLWLVQVSFPFLLGLGFIYLMYRIIWKFTGLGR